MGLIYKLTFPNGKIYIGMTKVLLTKRLYCHAFKAKAKCPKLLLHRVWKKYGSPNSQILAMVENHELSSTEIRAIKIYNSYGDGGYNMTPGGEDSPMLLKENVEKVRALALTPDRIKRNIEIHFGSKRSAETRQEMSRQRKGRKLSTETCQRMSVSAKARGIKPPSPIGRKHNNIIKSIMSDKAKKRWADPRFKTRMIKIAIEREAKKRMS